MMGLRRQMAVPDDLVWTHILGVLIGQADGEVFIPQAAVVAVERFDLEIEGSVERDGWYVRLKKPAVAACDCPCHNVIQPGLVPCPQCSHGD